MSATIDRPLDAMAGRNPASHAAASASILAELDQVIHAASPGADFETAPPVRKAGAAGTGPSSTAGLRPPGMVLFAEDFDLAPKRGAMPEPEIIEPSFTASELEAVREQAWKAGHDAAIASVEQANNTAIRDAVCAIAAKLDDARTQAAQTAQQATDALARLLLDSFAALLPALCARHGEPELRHLVRTLLPALSQEPDVAIRVNPENAGAVRQQIEMLDPDLATRLQIVTTDSMPPGDIRISWRSGQATRDTAALWAKVAAILAPAGLLSYAASKEMEHVE